VLLRAFCQRKIEYQVRKCRVCERLDAEKHGWAWKKNEGRLYESSYRR